MLSQGSFTNGLKRLVGEYEGKGFKMSKERAAEWYKHFQNMTDEEYREKIDYVIENSSYVPSLADVLKAHSQTEERKGLLGWD